MIKYLVLFSIVFLKVSTQTSLAQSFEKIHAEWDKKGETLTSFFGVSLYTGALYTPNDEPFDINSNFALTLTYLRSFKAATLVKSTIKEINRIEGLTVKNKKDLSILLSECFSDVSAGDKITALANTRDSIRFFYNGIFQCDLKFKSIRKSFFSIWLSKNSRDTKGSLRLQGFE